MNNKAQEINSTRNLTLYFILVFLLALPFYLIAYLVQGDMVILLTLPMTAAPITAGLILSYRKSGVDGAKKLLKRAFDYKRITNKIWYIPILFFWPVIFFIGSIIFSSTGESAPEPLLPIFIAPIALILFFILGYFEEGGWMGYAYEPMEQRWKALNASLILGIIWAAWHFPLYLFGGRETQWIIGQMVTLLTTRILIVFIFNNTGKSLFAAIVFHGVYNLCTILTTSYYTSTGHTINTILLGICTIAVILLCDANTLTRFRFSKNAQELN